MKTISNKTIILSASDVQELIRHVGIDVLMDTLIERLEAAFRHFNPELTRIPARSGFNYKTPQVGLVEWMPLYNHGEQVVIKVVGYHPQNPAARKMPTILSTISAYHTSTGHLYGLIDGVLLTALRTGAASAVASRLMARHDSSTLGLIGCGAQAIAQLHALSRVFRLEKVLLYDIDPHAVFSFRDRCAALSIEVYTEPASIERIVGESDILCTATSIPVGTGPLFSDLPTRAHLHINAVGSDFPGKVELPVDLLKKSFVCPDFIKQAVIEGECQQLSGDHIGPEIVSVAKEPHKYKYVKDQISVFDSTGWALEDQVAMDLLLSYARELGLGQELEIEHIPEDAKNPYHFLGNEADKVNLAVALKDIT